jgi:hypothetical protein
LKKDERKGLKRSGNFAFIAFEKNKNKGFQMQSNLTYEKIQTIFGWKKQYCDFLILILRALCASETTALVRLSLYLGYEKQKSALARLIPIIVYK